MNASFYSAASDGAPWKTAEVFSTEKRWEAADFGFLHGGQRHPSRAAEPDAAQSRYLRPPWRHPCQAGRFGPSPKGVADSSVVQND